MILLDKLYPHLEYDNLLNIIRKLNDIKKIKNILEKHFQKQIISNHLIGKAYDLLHYPEYLVLDLPIENKIVRFDDNCYKFIGSNAGRDYLVLSNKPVCFLEKSNLQLVTHNNKLNIMRGNLFYCELSLLSENHRHEWLAECVSFGFCYEECNNKKQVGWENGCIGIHTDDGGIFSGDTFSFSKIGKINQGNVIGIGIISKINYYIVFFTLNGKKLISKRFYSDKKVFLGMGLDTSYSVELNLGKKPFNFDLLKYYSAELWD